MEEYKFTFNQSEKSRFSTIMSRLDPDEYVIVQDFHLTDPENARYSDIAIVIKMEPEAASTFRFGMKQLKIRRTRTEEELAAEKERDEKNKISVIVKVNGLQAP